MARTFGAAALPLVLLAGAPAWASPQVRVEPDRVSIEEVTAGGRVAVIGMARRVYERIPGFQRWEEVVVDADGDGRVEVVLEEPANPEWSIWVAVDLGTGEAGVGGWPERTEGSGIPGVLPTGETLAAGAALWRVPVGIFEVLVVRPGEGEVGGAWGGSVWDGGSADGDGLSDGSAAVAPASLRPVGDSGPAPVSYAAGDVLVAVKPRGLSFGITTVGAAGGEVSR